MPSEAKLRKIVGIKVVKAGSPPDIDSDFHTVHREDVIRYVTDLYGAANVSNVVTFNTLAARSAFKTMCTIYSIPFAEANRIAALIPAPVEGVECTLSDLFDSSSDRYAEGSDFRSATSDATWKDVLSGARAIEGRIKSTGMHACGLIISSHHLTDTVPLMVRQKDSRVLTQWTYPQCEALGLIKMDFLGLDTVDLIQRTVGYIAAAGKNPPNMVDLIHGNMDDPDTFRLFSEGHTVGIFQFGSEMVRQLLVLMRPDSFMDLAACTAVARPGPMGMDSHTRYADRKNGREKVDFIHPEFAGSVVEDILRPTYGLCLYQEQVMQIAAGAAGMTLQEADRLRKAMGKKKRAVMDAMRPKFFAGAAERGFSDKAVTVLWDTIAEFAKYGFNKSHSVAYAMNAYQAGWLKTHYPVEFMAALICQSVGNKTKTLSYLQEAHRMGLDVGTVDINRSAAEVAPSPDGSGVLFGIHGVMSVSQQTAALIISEREQNGPFSSVQDVIVRCVARGVDNRTTYQSLAQAGAFDNLGDVSRQTVFERVPQLMAVARTHKTMGACLFDMPAAQTDVASDLIDVSGPDFPYVERLFRESQMVGAYLSAHPLGRMDVPPRLQLASVSRLVDHPDLWARHGRRVQYFHVVVSVTEVTRTSGKRGARIVVGCDDGTTTMMLRASSALVKAMAKSRALTKADELVAAQETCFPPDVVKSVMYPAEAHDPIIPGGVYVLDVSVEQQWGAMITRAVKVRVCDDGTLPVRIRFPAAHLPRARKILSTLNREFPGDTALFAAPSRIVRPQTDSDLLARMSALDPHVAAVPRDEFEHFLSLRDRSGTPPTAAEYRDTRGRVRVCDDMIRRADSLVGWENVDLGLDGVRPNGR